MSEGTYSGKRSREDYMAYALLLGRIDYWDQGLRNRPNFRAAYAETWKVVLSGRKDQPVGAYQPVVET